MISCSAHEVKDEGNVQEEGSAQVDQQELCQHVQGAVAHLQQLPTCGDICDDVEQLQPGLGTSRECVPHGSHP